MDLEGENHGAGSVISSFPPLFVIHPHLRWWAAKTEWVEGPQSIGNFSVWSSLLSLLPKHRKSDGVFPSFSADKQLRRPISCLPIENLAWIDFAFLLSICFCRVQDAPRTLDGRDCFQFLSPMLPSYNRFLCFLLKYSRFCAVMLYKSERCLDISVLTIPSQSNWEAIIERQLLSSCPLQQFLDILEAIESTNAKKGLECLCFIYIFYLSYSLTKMCLVNSKFRKVCKCLFNDVLYLYSILNKKTTSNCGKKK